jgi:hypothetical protein
MSRVRGTTQGAKVARCKGGSAPTNAPTTKMRNANRNSAMSAPARPPPPDQARMQSSIHRAGPSGRTAAWGAAPTELAVLRPLRGAPSVSHRTPVVALSAAGEVGPAKTSRRQKAAKAAERPAKQAKAQLVDPEDDEEIDEELVGASHPPFFHAVARVLAATCPWCPGCTHPRMPGTPAGAGGVGACAGGTCGGRARHPARQYPPPVRRPSTGPPRNACSALPPPPPLPRPCAPQAPLFDSVIKVFCIHTEPNYSLPWQRKRQASTRPRPQAPRGTA